MLRARRAARIQAGSSGDHVWLDELQAQQRLVFDLAAEPATLPPGSMPEASSPPGSGVEVATMVDPSVLADFMDACQSALRRELEAFAPARAVFVDAYPKVCARAAPRIEVVLDVEERRRAGEASGGDGAATFRDPDAIRRNAVSDAAQLVVESALYEVVRRIVDDADRTRRVTAQSDPGGVAVRNGRIVRPKPAAGEKARANALRNFPHYRAKMERERLARSLEEDPGLVSIDVGGGDVGGEGA